MIQQLRRKLVLINMSLVLVVLLVVFTGLCLYTENTQQQNATRTLSLLLERRAEDVPKLEIGKSKDRQDGLAPKKNDFFVGFVLLVDNEGTASIQSVHSVNINDETAQTLAQIAINSKQDSGLIRD